MPDQQKFAHPPRREDARTRLAGEENEPTEEAYDVPVRVRRNPSKKETASLLPPPPVIKILKRRVPSKKETASLLPPPPVIKILK